MSDRHITSRRTARLPGGAGVSAASALTVADAAAQGWGGLVAGGQHEQRAPPMPREPMRPPPGSSRRASSRRPGSRRRATRVRRPTAASAERSNICLQLEQRLVAETQGGNQGRELLPKIEERHAPAGAHRAQLGAIQLDRADCWDQFLFSKTLRRTPRCIQLNSEVESARQRLADLEAPAPPDHGHARPLVPGRHHPRARPQRLRPAVRAGSAPARKRAQSRSPSLFGARRARAPRGTPNQFGNLPFATYRTLCVRLCDGYYFPVSFSTLPNHFQRDSDLCQSQCAAPAELYYHQNPGGAVEQMVSVGNQQPYTSLKSAWRYRKEFVQGCSCKAAEYKPGPEKKAEAQPAAPPGSGVRVGATK